MCSQETNRVLNFHLSKMSAIIVLSQHNLPTQLSSCQGYHNHCVVTSSDGGMGKLGVVHLC